MRRWNICVLLPLLCLLPACSGISIEVDHDKYTNFSSFHRYAWSPDGQKVVGSRIPVEDVQKRMKNLIDDQLKANGYLFASAESADFLVDYYCGRVGKSTKGDFKEATVLGTKVRVAAQDKSLGGIIMISMRDPTGGRRLLWRGTARVPMEPRDTPDHNFEVAREMVSKLLERFPPR